jgi:bloom syndrome protein
MLSSRLEKLKAVLASKLSRPTGASTPPPPHSSGSTLTSNPISRQSHLYPTPETSAGPSRIRAAPITGSWDLQRSKGLSSDEMDSHANTRQILGEVHIPPEVENIPPTPSPPRNAPPTRKRRLPTPAPDIDDVDIAMAEEDAEEEQYPDVVPDSSPPRPATSRTHQTPTRTKPAKVSSKSQAIAELQDIPSEAFFSPPGPSRTPPQQMEASSSRSIRVEGSTARSVKATKPVRVEVIKHAWTKEVDQKLRHVFQLPAFRKHQKEAIDETMAGKDGQSVIIWASCQLTRQ